MKNNCQIVLVIVLGLVFTLTSCKNNNKTAYDASGSEYEFVDEAPIEDYISTWQYEVLVKEDKAENPGEDYLYVGGFKYKGLALKNGNNYIRYSPGVDYYDMVKTFLLADHICMDYQKSFEKSNGIYPSKSDWKKLGSEILSYIRDEIPDWTKIPDAALRKSAGDFYTSIKNSSPEFYAEGADYKGYIVDRVFPFINETLTYYVGFRSASKDNTYGIPEDALIITEGLSIF